MTTPHADQGDGIARLTEAVERVGRVQCYALGKSNTLSCLDKGEAGPWCDACLGRALAARNEDLEAECARLAAERDDARQLLDAIAQAKAPASSEQLVRAEMAAAVARAERDALAASLAEQSAVCICGCPVSEHESYGEDGEACEQDTHECFRTSKAALAVVHALRVSLAEQEQEIKTLQRRIEHFKQLGASVAAEHRQLQDIAAQLRLPAPKDLQGYTGDHTAFSIIDSLTKERDALKAERLTKERVEWVVNDSAELGVKIGDQFFFCYKGHSLVYKQGTHDDGRPMMWRLVFKREFGECIHPINYADPRMVGTVSLSDSDEWKPLPAPPALSSADPADQSGEGSR